MTKKILKIFTGPLPDSLESEDCGVMLFDMPMVEWEVDNFRCDGISLETGKAGYYRIYNDGLVAVQGTVGYSGNYNCIMSTLYYLPGLAITVVGNISAMMPTRQKRSWIRRIMDKL